MSIYPYFDGPCVLQYDAEASRILGADYWRRMQTYNLWLSARQRVHMPAGALTDKGSVPAIAWPLVPRDGEFEQAYDTHDQLCEYLSLTVDGRPHRITRERADSLLYVAMEVLGGTDIEIGLVRAAVDANRILRNVTKPSSPALKRELESKWVC